MSNKLIKQHSPLDTEVKCSLCSKTFWGPTGDMRSERGTRFAQSLLKHIGTAHPQDAQEIIRSTDPWTSYCTIRLFSGDANFTDLLEQQKAELLNWIDPQEPDRTDAEFIDDEPAPTESDRKRGRPSNSRMDRSQTGRRAFSRPHSPGDIMG
jgi:hypothetical protein